MSEDLKGKSKVLYADGVSKIGISPFMSKITLELDDTKESIILVLPTSTLFNLTRNLIDSFSRDGISENFDQAHEKIKENLEEIRKK